MELLKRLHHRLQSVDTAIAGLRDRLDDLEDQRQKLGIAIEVISKVADDDGLEADEGTAPNGSLMSRAQERLRAPVRQLVLEELRADVALTKVDIVARINARGVEVNSATVGSTLSRLVVDNLAEKDGNTGYRKKGEGDVNASTSTPSGATSSDLDDLA